MIYFTRAVDYAIRALLWMARHPHQGIDVKTLAREEDLPEAYLGKLLQKLKKAGLVSSQRGLKGGFVLEKHAGLVSIMEIIDAVEGFDVQDRRLSQVGDLIEKRVWRQVNRAAEDHLTSTTLARLVADMDAL